MTNRQFQGFIRLLLELAEEALKVSPENEKLNKLVNIIRDMLEDGIN